MPGRRHEWECALSPSSLLYGMHDSNALATFSYMIGELSTRQVGYPA
jgi:hypothetical protein